MPDDQDVVDEALARAGEERAKERKPTAPAKKRGRDPKATYADYAPSRFNRHPLARVINGGLDFKFPPEPGSDQTPELPSAKTLEVGEALTAAAYWGAGLPPYSPQKGDGHPYIVAAERTAKFAAPRLMRTTWAGRLMATIQGKFRKARGQPPQDDLVRP